MSPQMREKIPSSNRRPAQRVYTCGDKKGGKVCVYEVCAMQRKCETRARRGDDQIWHRRRLEDVTKWNHEENGFSGMSVEFWDVFCIQGRVSKHCGYFRLTQKDISSYCDFSFLAFSIKCKKEWRVKNTWRAHCDINSLFMVVEDINGSSSSHEPHKPAHVCCEGAQFTQVQPE